MKLRQLSYSLPLFLAVSASAAPAVYPLGNAPDFMSRSQVEQPQTHSDKRIPTRVGAMWLGENFFSERMPTRGRPQQQFMSFVGELAGSAQLGAFELDGHARGYLGFPFPEDYTSLEVIEASFGFAFVRKPELKVSLHVGRRTEEWNLADRTWALGFMEPQYRWDLLRPSRNGLTGAFLEARYKKFSITAFGSGIALPESGPSSSLKNGVFRSSHPMYTPSPDATTLMGVETPIRYTIEMPPLEQLVLKPAVGGIIAYDSGKEGFFASAAYQYKPVTQPLLAMRHQGVFNIAVNELQPLIRPQIVYSHTAGLDAGYRFKWSQPSIAFTPWVSVLGDVPEEPKYEEGFTTQRFTPGVLASAGVDAEIWDIGIKASFLQTFGGVATDVGLLSPGNYGSLFGNRYPFRSAFSLGVARTFNVPGIEPARTSYERNRQGLTVSARWMQEFSVSGTILSGEVEYGFARHMSVGIGADLIAAQGASAINGGGGYVPGMSGYDRVRASFKVEL